uniref:MAM domain-containing protein n=1 Tax=Cyclopterus lumpus TaxID=8103 RepID=A0A8C3G9E7_CYCLU
MLNELSWISLCVFMLYKKQLVNKLTSNTNQHVHNSAFYVGYYLSAQLWSHPVGSRGAVMTAVMEPTAADGECLMFWYYMEGSEVGELSVYLQTLDGKGVLLWTRSGDQGKHWRHGRVTLFSPSVVFKAAHVPGTNSTVKLDDISVREGACSPPGSCDFEAGQCTWVNIPKEDGHDWVLASGGFQGPPTDHTTQTPEVQAAQFQRKGACVQLWYHMYGKGMGLLNVYQQTEEGTQALIFSQTGDQGRLWRFAQIVVEGVKAGPTQEGDMAFDDVRLTDTQCPPPGHCDFESNSCSWSNLGGGVDQGDWLRGRGASPNPSTGPCVDHTTNSTRETKTHSGGDEEGILKWIETGNQEARWQEASVTVKHGEAFWVTNECRYIYTSTLIVVLLLYMLCCFILLLCYILEGSIVLFLNDTQPHFSNEDFTKT